MDVNIRINGQEDKESFDRGKKDIIKLLNDPNKKYLIFGCIEIDNKLKSFAFNNCSIGQGMMFMLSIKKAEKELLKAFQEKFENDFN